MTLGASPSHQRFVSLFAVIGGMTGMAMFYGYTGPLLSIVLEDNGVSGTLIGFNSAVQMASVFIILPFLPARSAARDRGLLLGLSAAAARGVVEAAPDQPVIHRISVLLKRPLDKEVVPIATGLATR